MHVRPSVMAVRAAGGGADGTKERLSREIRIGPAKSAVPDLEIVARSRVASIAEPPTFQEVMLTITT